MNHAAADAIVAQAAAVWNVPTASLVLAKGGALSEHVSGANVFAGADGPVFPADLQTTNYAAKQIAVIYDADGSVTDLLRGADASDPLSCLQNGVTESVDGITPQAQIQHALLVLNGRCTGPQPEKQLQLQYQLVRAFGRILGLSWSQTNDNVFTGSPLATHDQAMNWPIMHPIDIVCGLYTYQCLPQPFTLRPDDISSLEQLYFIPQGQAAPGKIASWTSAGGAYGRVSFPNGQGMEGVNVVVRRRPPFSDFVEGWQTASSVSGYSFRGVSATAITAPGSSAAASMGTADGDREGYWRIQAVPVMPSTDWNDLIVSTEPINPLYIGPYAIGPEAGDTIDPSGSPQVQVSQYLGSGRDNYTEFVPSDAAPVCPWQNDGAENAAAPVPSGGWWNGTICGYQHHAWTAVSVKANRTWTVEVTALDEQGQISLGKLMPILGVWNASDAPGIPPTVASTEVAFNSMSVGISTLRLSSSSSPASFRIGLADQRGAGRPDFAYGARVLYADAVSPANVSADGGTVTVTGIGFRQGNAVLINGFAATVTSWSPTSITAVAPSLHVLGMSRATVASVAVLDVSTGGSSTISAALTYAAPVEALHLLSAPAATVVAGAPAATTFSVKAIAPDGFTPIVGEAISFSVAGVSASLTPCGSPCTVMTNASGVASVLVTPATPGVITLSASGRSGRASATFTATPNTDILRLLSTPSGVLTTGVTASTPLGAQLVAADGATPRAGAVITLSLLSGQLRLSACSLTPCTLITDASGAISTNLTPVASGSISIQLASAATSVRTAFSSAPETLHLGSAPAGNQTVGTASPTPFSLQVLAGDGVTPMAGESVVLSASGVPVVFSACGGAVCTLTTDAAGTVHSQVIPSAAGTGTLSAVSSAGAVTAAFQAVRPPDILRVVSEPAPALFVADVSTFSVRITAADGVTLVAGVPVTFSVTTGSATLGAGSTPTCTVSTDASGLAAIPVIASAPGAVTVLATAAAGSAVSSFTAAPHIRTIAASRPVLYLAEGAVFAWSPQVILADNSAAAGNIAVSWTAAPGFSFAQVSTLTDADGKSISAATTGPLAARATAQASVCAWISTCTTLAVKGVSLADLRITVAAGARQSVAASSSLAPVLAQVTDTEGNPVAGAVVQIQQTVSTWEAPCPVGGRCPPTATLSSTSTTLISAEDGSIAILPAQIDSQPALTHIAAIAGSQGFVSADVEKHP